MIRRNELNEVVFDPRKDHEEFKSCLREIFRTTDAGRNFVKNCFTEENEDLHTQKLISAASLISGSSEVGISHLTRALELLLDSGEIQPREYAPAAELTEPEEDTRPRDKNGKLLSLHQIAWSEFRQYSETHSSEDCRRRARTDAGFANFMRKNLEREMGGGVGDAVTPVGDQGTKRVEPTNELAEFARAYHAEPAANLKPRGGYVLLAGQQMPYSRFIEMVNKCAAIKLI
jgi:hypothetical protein